MSDPRLQSISDSGANQGTFNLELGSTKTVIRINAIPVISAPPLAKSIAFNSLTTALYHNRHSLTPANCINALIMHIPVPAASAESEANRYANMFRDQFLQVKHITPKAFLTKSGKVCTADPLQVIAGHIPHVRYALVESSINPSKLCQIIMGPHRFTSVFATALQNALPNARLEFCVHLSQDTINPFTTTTDIDSDNDYDDDTVTGNNPSPTQFTPSPNPPANQLPILLTNWNTASQKARKELSNEDLHNIIEASLRHHNNLAHPTPSILQTPSYPPETLHSGSTPFSPAILAALSHPGTSHTHATTYRGNFSFTEDQDDFNILLAIDDPCLIISNPNGGTPTLDYTSVQATINSFINTIQYTLFCELLFSQYVGKAQSDINSSEFTSDTIRQIKRLRLHFTHAGKTTILAPDDLYSKYISLTHTLPHDAREWHASLPSMFLDALSPELQIYLCNGDNPYIQPTFDTLNTKFDQESALLQLRELSVKAAFTLATRHKEMETTFKSMLHKHTPSTNSRTLSTYGRPQDSLAETTICQHLNHQPHNDISFVTQHGHSYPSRTIQGRLIISDWPADFIGCLSCGKTNHFWQTCPNNTASNPIAKKKFFDNLWCHKPHTYKSSTTTLLSPSAVTPAPLNLKNSSQQLLPQPPIGLPPPPNCYTNSNGKRPAPHLYAITAHILQQSTSGKHIAKMPITIHNGLPCIILTLGPLNDASSVTLAVLWDSCAALNSGNLQFHCWIMHQYPHLVSEFIMFNDHNPFEPIKLSGAVTNPDNYDIDTHGQLTGIIRYFTPYLDLYNQPITISFGLGENVSVNSIIGWPAILDMNMDLSISSMTVISHTLQRNFPITCRQSTLGPPPGTIFDTAAFLHDRHMQSALALVTHPSSTLCAPEPIAGVFDDFSAGFACRNISQTPLLAPKPLSRTITFSESPNSYTFNHTNSTSTVPPSGIIPHVPEPV